MKRLIVMVSPKSSTFTEVHFIDIGVGNICEVCAIAVQCVSFMWVCFGWVLRWRLIAGLHTLLQSRYIILWNRSMKTNTHKFEILKSATMKISRAVRRKVNCFAVYISETNGYATCDIMSPLAVRTWYKYRYLRCLASSRVSRGRLDARWCMCRRLDCARLRWSTRHAVMKHCTSILNTISMG